MKKIGFICLALVLAIGALGVGYAAWTDEVVINGTVNTGSVDLTVENWSNTWVWKVPAADNEIVVIHSWETDSNNDVPPAGTLPVGPGPQGEIAWADSDYNGDDMVYMSFYNLFPCIDFVGDFLLHYTGSIPVIVSVDDITIDNPDLAPYMNVVFYESNEFGDNLGVIENGIDGVQMHYCDYVIVSVEIHIPQEYPDGSPTDDLMNQNGTIAGKITAIQWNEFEAP